MFTGVALKAALATASFMPEGGQIGCALTHLYPVTSGKPFEPTVLRGADAAIIAAGAQLGLITKVSWLKLRQHFSRPGI